MKQIFKSKGWGRTGTGPPPTDDLTSITRDSLFSAQLQLPDPTALSEKSLRIANICVLKTYTETDHYACSVFRTLAKAGIIDGSGHPDTTKIDRSIVSKIGIISVPKQRELVNMLFFWEEELIRWRLLDNEVAEIASAISSRSCNPEEASNMQEKLAIVEAKKKVLPSLRRQDGTLKVTDGDPPAYAD